jgi:hypothetical protein
MVAGNIPFTLLSRRGAALLVLIGLAGCPKPQEKFDDFVKRVGAGDLAPGPDLAVTSKVYDVSGTFLLAVSTTLSPDRPLQMRLESKLTPGMAGTATLDLSFQPLKLFPDAAADRTPVGMGLEAKGVMVNANGAFEIPLTVRKLEGAANPVSGSPIDADLNLRGTILSADRMCGDVTGMVLMPVQAPLAGSTWSAIRVPGGPSAITKESPKAELKCPAGGGDAGVGDASARD